MPKIEFPDKEKEEYVNPDDIYGDNGKVTFICGDVFGKYEFLYSRDRYKTHAELIADHAVDTGYAEKEKLFSDYGLRGAAGSLRREVQSTALLGRVGTTQQREYISFWNRNEIYDKYLYKSFEELVSKHLVEKDDLSSMWISTPYGTGPYESIIKKVREAPDLTPEQEKRYAMQQRLHFARGEEKKELRKALGLWSDKPAEPGLHGQMMKHRFDPEVAKWWTPECNLNFKEWVATV